MLFLLHYMHIATLLWNLDDVSSLRWSNIYSHPVGGKRCFPSFFRDRWIYFWKLGSDLSAGELPWVSKRLELRLWEQVVIISVGPVKSGNVFWCKGNTTFWKVQDGLWLCLGGSRSARERVSWEPRETPAPALAGVQPPRIQAGWAEEGAGSGLQQPQRSQKWGNHAGVRAGHRQQEVGTGAVGRGRWMTTV